MGLFGKIKNIFYDVEEIEVPVKNEEKTISPKIEELKVEEEKPNVKDLNTVTNEKVSERELFKSKNTFNFPIFEADEEETEKPNVEITSRVREKTFYEEPRREVRIDRVKETPKQSRVFTPSPVISPVYGILDKNYKKEEVVSKREDYIPKKSEKNYDYVRSKAFGTLEDELENTLTKIEPKSTLELTQDLTESIEKIEESSKNIEDLLSEVNNNATVGQMEEKYKDKIEDEEKDIKLDNTLEHDLFNLIDSMYENKEE